jgi:hypothetical protein
MTTPASRGPVTVANTVELRAAIVAGYSADEIVLPNTDQAIAAARNEGITEGERRAKSETANEIAAARAEGVSSETKRIKDVQAASLPGHDALIQTLMFDGKTTGPEAAAQVIVAERGKLGKRLEDITADASAASVAAPPAPKAAPATTASKVDPNLPLEDRCKAEYQSDPQLRSEFACVEDYVAYAKADANGQARILRQKRN